MNGCSAIQENSEGILSKTRERVEAYSESAGSSAAEFGISAGKDQRYIVDGKACGQLFKWSRWAGTVEVRNCIFRWDQMAVSGPTPMNFPKESFENDTLIWLGERDFPKPLPDGVKLSRDVRIREEAKAAWLERHAKK